MRWHDWKPQEAANEEAFCLWRDGALTKAAASFEARLDAAPNCAEAWRGLGSVRWTEGAFPTARACFARALSIEPCNPMHWGNLGLALRDLRRYDAAIAAFTVATGLDAAYEPAWNEWANVLIELGSPAEALPLYERAIAIEPERAVLHHNRAVCLRLLGRRDEAHDALAQALVLHPGYWHSIEELERTGSVLIAVEPLGPAGYDAI